MAENLQTNPEMTLQDQADQALVQQIAKVQGQAFTISQLPQDLYIPPEALEVFLDAFEGPLDLLLYLIKKHNLDILDIPIADITRQYVEYVELMKDISLELAGEYLVMSATLAHIKSRMLLPRSAEAEEEEEDPRAALVRRLQEYEQFKKAAQDLDVLPRLGRDVFDASAHPPENDRPVVEATVSMQDLMFALKDVMSRAEVLSHHHIQKESLSVREMMSHILDTLKTEDFTDFTALFKPETGRVGVVVTFLALLELVRETLVELVQTQSFGPIHVRAT